MLICIVIYPCAQDEILLLSVQAMNATSCSLVSTTQEKHFSPQRKINQNVLRDNCCFLGADVKTCTELKQGLGHKKKANSCEQSWAWLCQWSDSPRRWTSGWTAAWPPAVGCAGFATPGSCALTRPWVFARWWCGWCGPRSRPGPWGPHAAPTYSTVARQISLSGQFLHLVQEQLNTMHPHKLFVEFLWIKNTMTKSTVEKMNIMCDSSKAMWINRPIHFGVIL